MTSGIVPRPIAYVSSISEDGVENISPFRLGLIYIIERTDSYLIYPHSWFNMVSTLYRFPFTNPRMIYQRFPMTLLQYPSAVQIHLA